jgi:hypothetical protein
VNHRNAAIGAVALVLVCMATLTLILSTFNAVLQAINPLAAATAITIAIVGIVWFKKTCN